jgi:hypothetical protein
MTGFEELETEYDKSIADLFVDVVFLLLRKHFSEILGKVYMASWDGVVGAIEDRSIVGLDMDISEVV